MLLNRLFVVCGLLLLSGGFCVEDFSQCEAKIKFAPSSKSIPKPTEEKEFKGIQFRESALAHAFLDGLRGLEIGASAQNPFGLKTLNVDYTDDLNTRFKQEEIELFGSCVKVDIVASGDDLPFKDKRVDFVISSHVIEHFYDPIKTMKEWWRVVRPGGYIYIIAPHKERTFDKPLARTKLAELIERHEHPNPPEVDHHGHYSVWITADFEELCQYYGWPVIAVQDVDDKVGNGFTIVIQKPYKK